MNKSKRKNPAALIGLFVMMMLIFAVQANAATYVNSLTTSGTNTLIEEKTMFSAADEWTINLKNDKTNSAKLAFSVFSLTKNGTISRAPSFELNYKGDVKLYTIEAEAQYSAVIEPGQSAVLKIYYSSYPSGGGSYDFRIGVQLQEIIPKDPTLIGGNDPNCTHMRKDESGREVPYFWNGECKRCGAVCTHPKVEVHYYQGNTGREYAGQHYKETHCTRCYYGLDHTDYGTEVWTEKSYTEKCVRGSYKANSNGVSHWEVCKYCKADMTWDAVSCITNKTTFKYCKQEKSFLKKGEIHHNFYKCPCGNLVDKAEKHHFKKNKCVDCGYKRVKAGKLTNIKITKTKPKKHNYSVTGTYNGIHGTYHHVCYDGTMTISYKKSKNVSKVYLEIRGWDTAFGSNGLNGVCRYNGLKTKTKLKCKFTSGGKGWTYKVYLTPYSKTGDKGKTIVKTVKM